jgi:hypothetical protein
LNNIFGVDIDSQAVEVTKLSLLLKLMEGESQESAGMLFKFSDIKMLPDLSGNIKCGNSLIGSDFYETGQMNLFQDEATTRRINVFDWDKEFPNIFKNGGFDVVIGNPPYIRSHILEKYLKNYFNQRYSSAFKSYDIYVLFIEKVINLMKNDGLLGYIVSNKFLVSDYGERIREFILQNTEFIKAIDVSYEKVFSKASIYPYIIILKKQEDNAKRERNKIAFCSEFKKNKSLNFIFKSQNKFNKSPNIFDFTSIGYDWVNKVEKNSINLGMLTNITRGFRPPNEELQKIKNANEKYLIGQDLKSAYYFEWSGKIVNYIESKIYESKPLKIFKEPKLLFRDIGLKLNASYDDKGFLCLKTIYFLYLKENTSKYSLKYFLGILNSLLINKYFKLKFSIMHIQGGYLRFRKQFMKQIPIYEIDFSNNFDKSRHDKMVEMVDQMLDVQKKYHNAKLENEKKMYKKQIDILDKQIDQLVYKLYGLTEEEINIVEGGE